MQTFKLTVAALIALAVLYHSSVTLADDSLAGGFANPPISAHPQTWWHWMNGNISKEGITADLEAMHRVGIVEANIITVANDIPPGKVPVMSPQFFDMVEFAAKEADRLGMTLCMDNCPGWSSSGGPWVTPDKSMFFVTSSQTHVTGGKDVSISLPQPPTTLNYYKDIAVLAYPSPGGDDGKTLAEFSPKVSSSAPNFDADMLLKGDKFVTLPLPAPGQPQYIQMDFPADVKVRTITLTPGPSNRETSGEIQISDDGAQFAMIREFDIARGAKKAIVINLAKTISTRHLRVNFIRGATAATGIFIQKIEIGSSLAVDNIARKAVYEAAGPDPLQVIKDENQEFDPTMVVRSADMVDLTSKMQPDGSLKWSAPPGDWTIMRIAYTPTGVTNHPAPPEATGLECDKFSHAGLDASWNGMMQPILDRLGPLGKKVLKHCLIDSYEVGGQNWTPAMADEFKKRRGYDPTKYLPALSGHVVDSPMITERFLWDLRRTASDLFADNYFGYFTQLCHEHGMTSMIEPYTGPFESLEAGSQNDIPMAEFWTGSEGHASVKMASSVGHIYGQPIIAAESFTGQPDHGSWKEDPYSLKQLGDLAFSQGINRFVFHRYAHQPWMNRFPGMTMGQWGINLERTNTWFEESGPWMDYLSRCQFLLQQGTYVADVAYFCGESSPVVSRKLEPELPTGYSYDQINTDVLLHKASVKNGRLTLDDGESYSLLVLPPSDPEMTPDLLGKIGDFVKDGLTVLVNSKPEHSPSLQDYPACDDQVNKIVAELWGECDGNNITEHSLGEGKLIWGEPLADVLAGLSIEPDFAMPGVQQSVVFLHRRLSDADVYFVANHSDHALHDSFTFRVVGKAPELWHPDTGVMEKAPVYATSDGGVTVPIVFGPAESIFFVFRSPDAGDHLVAAGPDDPLALTETDADRGLVWRDLKVDSNGTTFVLPHLGGDVFYRKSSGPEIKLTAQAPKATTLNDNWEVDFPPNWGAPASIKMDKLVSWPDFPDDGVKYFSGTATYKKTLNIPGDEIGDGKSLLLYLGVVKNLARVKLNGKDLGVLWKPPFKVDLVSSAVAGDNSLEISITNLWPNRIIGDLNLPDDTTWSGSKPADWPQWMLDGKPSPTGRLTFYTWKHFNQGAPLLPSGLIGPVTLESAQWVKVSAPAK